MRLLSPTRLGAALCLLAALAFALQPTLGQIAIDHGAALTALLGWRYAIAAAVLLALARRRRRALPLRSAVAVFALGVVLYTADSALFYAALERTSAPFASLLHYAHLAVVVGGSALLGRERLDARRGAALAAILCGVALVGGGGASVRPLGVALALASAAAYSAYIMVSDRILRGMDPVAFAGLLTAGAATAFIACGAATGTLGAVGGTAGAGTIVVGALVGSVVAVTAFLAGIRLVGPGTASLLVTIEVPVGLAVAATVLGERLTPAQLGGAALVVAAIALLQAPRVRRRARIDLPRGSATLEPAEALA